MKAAEKTQAKKFKEQGKVAIKKASPDRSIVYLSDDSPSGICMCRIECPGYCACASK